MSGRLHPMFTTRQSNNQEIVDYIGLLRSREYVAAFAKQRLSASLQAQHIADIAASFSQGIAYFNSAEQASIQIKPVLQYYGILNLVKGLCGLKKPDGDEQEAINDHGLRRARWNDHLVREVPNFLDLEVVTTTSKGGAFQQAISRAWHRNVVDVESMYPGPPWRITFIQKLGTPGFAEPKSCIRVRDVLARSRYVADTFATVVGESPRIHPVHMVAGGGQVGIYPAHWARGDPYAERLWIVGSKRTYRSPHSNTEVTATFFPEDDVNCPILHEGNELFGWAIEPFTNGDRLAEWIKLYILSYVFGMLCRYYPSQWLSLVSEYGAPLQGPIIHRTLHAIQQHFLREFSPQIAAIAGDTYFMGPDLGIFSETMIFDDYWK